MAHAVHRELALFLTSVSVAAQDSDATERDIASPAEFAAAVEAGDVLIGQLRKSARIPSWLIPAASQPKTSPTVMRMPRMHGLPPRLPGSW
jgi:hypothetical protein